MSKNSFQFPLNTRFDSNNEEYLIGSTDLPMFVDLRDVTFLVFYPEENSDKGTLLIRPRNNTPQVKDQAPPKIVHRPQSRSSQDSEKD
jgi:hypothetical protein